jgi:hypothetical protein
VNAVWILDLLPSKNSGGEIPSRLIISPPSQLAKIHGKVKANVGIFPIGSTIIIYSKKYSVLASYLTQ